MAIKIKRPVCKKTVQVRMYREDVERLEYLYTKELQGVDKDLVKHLAITQSDLIHFLIDKSESVTSKLQ